MQERVVLKTSTILIATGGKTQVFRSLDEMPAAQRQALAAVTTGNLSATLLIADEGGRREIMRSVHGKPSAVETRWVRSLAQRTGPTPLLTAPESRWNRHRHWAEIGLLAGIGVCLWLLAIWK